MNRRARFLAGLFIVLALTATAVSAKGQLQVRSTLVELLPKMVASRVVLANTGDQPVSAQVRLYAWTQEGGEDRLVESDQIGLSPAIVDIAPGAEQVIRLVRQGPAAVGSDKTYRLVVDQLPVAGVDSGVTVSMRIRFVLPLFVRAVNAPAPQLTCRLQSVILSCTNSGGQAAQLGQVRLADGKGHSVELNAGLFGYVLPNSLRQWSLESKQLSSLGADLRLESKLNGSPFSTPVARIP